MGWKRGCQPFSCPCSQNVTHCRNRLRNPFPLFFLAIPSIQSLPAAEVPASRSTLHQFCIMVASCPSLRCSCRKRTRLAEKQRVWSGSCGHQDLLQCSVCALSCGMRLLQTNEHLSRLSFQQQWVGSGAASLSAADVL